jgi:signal transduction histidine kinase
MTAAVPSTTVPRVSMWRVQAGGLVACAALGAALIAGPGGSAVPVIVLAAISGALFAYDGVARLVHGLRHGRAGHIAGVLAIIVVLLVGLIWVRENTTSQPRLFLVVLLFSLGAGLVGEWFVAALERLDRGGSPWQQLTSAPTGRSDAWRRVRLVIGALALLWATGIVLEALVNRVTPSLFSVVALLGAGGLLVVMAIVPIVMLEQARVRRAEALHTRALDRQAVAAHLHDSVLQTLALIQRTKDHDQIMSLARQQEHALRAWLAGRDESAGTTLASALRAAAAEIEAEAPGVLIPVVTAGDATLDERIDAMVKATREALRNAARHAPGAEVRVFLEVEERELVVYVRDTGAGFSIDAVPEERRGVRDAILGRMAHAGGTAEIDSGPGGTEVVLRLPAHGRELPPEAGS